MRAARLVTGQGEGNGSYRHLSMIRTYLDVITVRRNCATVHSRLIGIRYAVMTAESINEGISFQAVNGVIEGDVANVQKRNGESEDD